MSVQRRYALSDDCLTCTLRRDSSFCNLSEGPLARLSEMGHISLFPADAVLLAEGQIPRGVFVICSGRAKLSVVTRDSKTVILKIAGERQVLGLSAVISGRPSPVTVTTVEPCQTKFVETESFLALIKQHALALSCAQELSREVQGTFLDVYELLLARSSTEKLARLLLSWVARDELGNFDVRLASDFTHEEMAQMIGSSRETVTRLLSDMRRTNLIRMEGSILIIPDRIALQAIAA
jgi:CRP/FNR family cyclic AMP-dependent transcriptional regulator